MTTVNTFLKVIKKMGYPNPNIQTIADASDYNLQEFLFDLKKEIGEDGVLDFCNKAIEKLSGKNGIMVNLETDGQEYVVVEVKPEFYDEDESENDIIVTLTILDSKIITSDGIGRDVYKTLPEIQDDLGLGDWGDYDEMMDHIKMKVYNYIFSRCGFGIWIQ